MVMELELSALTSMMNLKAFEMPIAQVAVYLVFEKADTDKVGTIAR